MEKFHDEHVPRSCLPSEFGGVCGTMEDLQQQMYHEFSEMREYFSVEEKQAALELDWDIITGFFAFLKPIWYFVIHSFHCFLWTKSRSTHMWFEKSTI